MDPPTTAPPAVHAAVHADGTIVEPVPRGLARALRAATLEHATSQTARIFPPVLHVGVPGAVVARLVLDPEALATDQALRVDLVEAMVRRARRPGPEPLVWLTRVGDLTECQDVDLEWLAATRTAAAELGAWLPMVLVNRRGWRDPRSGVGRTWQRLRSR